MTQNFLRSLEMKKKDGKILEGIKCYEERGNKDPFCEVKFSSLYECSVNYLNECYKIKESSLSDLSKDPIFSNIIKNGKLKNSSKFEEKVNELLEKCVSEGEDQNISFLKEVLKTVCEDEDIEFKIRNMR